MHLRGSGTKRCLKCIKNSFASSDMEAESTWNAFLATMIFKYRKMILNWFTFLHVINASTFGAIKIHFSVQKDDDDVFNGNCFFLFRSPCCSFDYIFNLFIFNGRFSTFCTRKEGGWGSAIKENSRDAYHHWKLFSPSFLFVH